MSDRSRAAIGIWRARGTRSTGDRAYAVYLAILVALVVLGPVARAVWLGTTSPSGIAVLRSPAAPTATALIVASLWAGALLLGRGRGPAVLPPFLTHALGSSELRRSQAFRGALLRAGLLVTSLTAITAGLAGGALASRGLIAPPAAVLFALAGALVGIIATAAWLAGQALPRAAVPVAATLLALTALTATVPGTVHLTPWGWVGMAYPGGASSLTLMPLAVLAAALLLATPALLDRLSLTELLRQATRWERATVHAASMDLSGAATIYQQPPRFGRRLRAVRPARRLPLTFLLRDAIGAARTPGRLLAGLGALATGGALVALAFVPTTPRDLCGAVAGILLFAGLGPFTDGIRHAAHVASGPALYGISDERLLGSHTLFPLAVVVVLPAVVALGCSAIAGLALAPPLICSLAVGLLTLIARIGNALKGPPPVALLTPISTPAGDLGAAVRMAWSLDALLLTALAGAAASHMLERPLLFTATAAVVAAVAVSRWSRRR